MRKNNKYFRIFLLIGIFTTTSIVSYSQSGITELNPIQNSKKTYKILSSQNISDLSFYEDAMSQANFDSYRFLNSRRNLIFESGVIIELLSINEVKALGISIDETKAVSEELPKGYIPPTYKITLEGKIVATYPLNPRKK